MHFTSASKQASRKLDGQALQLLQMTADGVPRKTALRKLGISRGQGDVLIREIKDHYSAETTAHAVKRAILWGDIR